MYSRKSQIKTRKGSPGLSTLISLGILFWQFSPALAAPSFPQAKADYESGKYSQALATFQTLSATYPTNALVHYYMALCHQNLGHMGQARAEYQIVVSSGQPQLVPLAAKGLATLAGARSSTSSSSGSSSSASFSAPSHESSTGSKVAMGKVKKVLEFWAEW
jgi:tetratricopeptide (TPR) repeat protein